MNREPRIVPVPQKSHPGTYTLGPNGGPLGSESPDVNPEAWTRTFYTPSFNKKMEFMTVDETKGYHDKAVNHYLRLTTHPETYYTYAVHQSVDPWTNDGHYAVWKTKSPLAHSVDGMSLVRFQATWPSSTFGDWDYPILGLSSFVSYDYSGRAIVLLPKTVDTLIGEALRSIIPGIRPELSLINSLVELKDFVTLKQTLTKLRQSYKSLFDMNKNKWGRRNLKSIIRSGSDIGLQTSFNVLPLLSDIRAIARAVSLTRKRVERLLADEGKDKVRHYVKELNTESYEYQQVQDDYQGQYLDGTVETTRYSRMSAPKFVLSLRYSYRLAPWERENALFLGFQDALGINYAPSIIWNAIPWSFVVDWVIGISDWLSQFTIRQIKPQLAISACCVSTKYLRTTSIQRVVGKGGQIVPGQPVTMIIVDEEGYVRTPLTGPESFVNPLKTSGLSLKEVALTGALAGSRLKL